MVAFFALLITGAEIVISHPRFYWGEVGNVMTRPLFTLPIPASRDTVTTAYHFVMPDQNGWSRYLHFQAAWLLVLTGMVYGVVSFWNGHFRRDVLPGRADRTWLALREVMAKYRRREAPGEADFVSYNAAQRLAYVSVIFVMIPLVIWTGLAMSPAFTSAFPFSVVALGGRQSARTIHFFVSGLLLLFVVIHVAMVFLSRFRNRMRAMLSGRVAVTKERP